MMSCTCSEPDGSSSGVWLYVQVWYNLFTCQWYKQSCRWKSVCVQCVWHTLFHIKDCLYCWHVHKLYHTCTYNCLPEDEPLGSEHVEDIIKIKIFDKCAFCWFILYSPERTFHQIITFWGKFYARIIRLLRLHCIKVNEL
jgi:hypothetical protein